MAKVLEALIAKGRRVRRPREQKEVAFGLADLSTHEELHERIVKKGGCKSLIQLLTKSSDAEAQRFSALALANIASAVFNRITMVQDDVLQNVISYIINEGELADCCRRCVGSATNLTLFSHTSLLVQCVHNA